MTAKKLFEQKKAALKAIINDNEMLEELEFQHLNNSQITTISSQMASVVGKPVWEDYAFKTGKIMGIVRFIIQNPKHRNELLAISGLSIEHLDLFYKYAGNLPYRVTENNSLNPGRKMNVDKTRSLVLILADIFDIAIDESDIDDITEERWELLVKNNTERVMKSVELNETAGSVLYEE